MTREIISVFDPNLVSPAISLNQKNQWIHIESRVQAREVIAQIEAKVGLLPDE